MGVREIVVFLLLGAAALVVVLSALGLVRAADPIVRLHFLTPLTSMAGPLVGIAFLVDRGINLDSGLVLAIVGLLALTGAPLSSAIARVTAEEQDLLPEEEPR